MYEIVRAVTKLHDELDDAIGSVNRADLVDSLTERFFSELVRDARDNEELLDEAAERKAEDDDDDERPAIMTAYVDVKPNLETFVDELDKFKDAYNKMI